MRRLADGQVQFGGSAHPVRGVGAGTFGRSIGIGLRRHRHFRQSHLGSRSRCCLDGEGAGLRADGDQARSSQQSGQGFACTEIAADCCALAPFDQPVIKEHLRLRLAAKCLEGFEQGLGRNVKGLASFHGGGGLGQRLAGADGHHGYRCRHEHRHQAGPQHRAALLCADRPRTVRGQLPIVVLETFPRLTLVHDL